MHHEIRQPVMGGDIRHLKVPRQSAVEAKPRTATISDFVSAASFWLPQKLTEPYSWVEHIPFAFWLTGALRPRCVVELGVHSGNSYFALCQSIQGHQLKSRSYAVDSWLGDGQAGFHGEEVFAEFSHYHTAEYSTFSTSIRAIFDEAQQQFADGSIDLLHIDGSHTYEAVKHDFDFWLPKMSEGGLVLLHNINFQGREYGVHRLWAEISQRFPHFEFRHGYGLGVLGVGRGVPLPISELMSANDNSTVGHDIRNAYARLGANVALIAAMEDRQRELGRLRTETVKAASDLRRAEERTQLSERTVQALRRINSCLEQQGQTAAAVHQQSKERIWSTQTALNAFKRSLSESNLLILDLRRQLLAIEQSAGWRLIGWLRSNPARGIRARLVLGRGAKIIWWTMTLQLLQRLRQWDAARQAPADPLTETVEAAVSAASFGTESGTAGDTPATTLPPPSPPAPSESIITAGDLSK